MCSPNKLHADDSTTTPHPSSSVWHVTNSLKAATVDPSGIPDCGVTGALTDTGNGFT